jgi:hypothetical protein
MSKSTSKASKDRHSYDESIIEELNERKEDLVKEIEEYNRERDQIKSMLGRLGGEKYSKTDMILNIIFLTTIVALFAVEVATQILPTYVSLEVGILLVSIKIIWMIHSQHKFNHFEFWVLNSIEFRMNTLDTRIKRMEKQMHSLAGTENGTGSEKAEKTSADAQQASESAATTGTSAR